MLPFLGSAGCRLSSISAEALVHAMTECVLNNSQAFRQHPVRRHKVSHNPPAQYVALMIISQECFIFCWFIFILLVALYFIDLTWTDAYSCALWESNIHVRIFCKSPKLVLNCILLQVSQILECVGNSWRNWGSSGWLRCKSNIPWNTLGSFTPRKEVRAGCCLAWVPFQRPIQSHLMSCINPSSRLRHSNSQLRSQAFSVHVLQGSLEAKSATQSGFPQKGSMAWLVPAFSLASVLALSIFPNHLIVTANRSQISLARI